VRLVLVSAIIVAVVVLSLPIALTPSLRTRLTQSLAERFDSDVDLASLRVSVLPRLRVSGSGVVLHHKRRSDVPPLITIASFTAEASLWGIVGRPIRLSNVHVDGLEINVPPGGVDLDSSADARSDTSVTPQARQPPPLRPVDQTEGKKTPLIVDSLRAEQALLRILRRDPGKPPRVWEIAHLSMEKVGANEPWPFHTQLTNPIPPGRLDVRGTFGPWNAPVPSDTPLGAKYAFRDADLGMFDGIRGVLQSSGEFKGILRRIEVTGTTETPEFALDDVGQPVPLTTQFTAIVDATNGNTLLQPVKAQLGQSPLVAQGGIVEREGKNGRTIELNVEMTDARIEDMLRLAVRSAEPALAGGLKLSTTFLLPPGHGKVIDKLQLDGSFGIASARFSEGGLQANINKLSQKAQGEAASGRPADRVASDFAGRFIMKGGAIRFSSLNFAVPGARLHLAGTYAIKSQALDFRGAVRIDAKLSELTTGFPPIA
jgi:hypothetical protein